MPLASQYRAAIEQMEQDVLDGQYGAALDRLNLMSQDRISHDGTGRLAILEYYRGLCHRMLGNFEEAAAAYDRCGLAFPPPNKKYRIFGPYISWLSKAQASQLEAIGRAMPFFCMTSMPQSASGFLTEQVSRVTGCVIVNPVKGAPYAGFEDWVVPAWIAGAARGGVVSHSHFSAFPPTLELLVEQGVRRLVVQVRDPRQSLYSRYVLLSKKIEALPEGGHNPDRMFQKFIDKHSRLETIYLELLPRYMAWLRGWMDYAQCDREIKVKFVDFVQVKQDWSTVVKDILSFFGVDPAPLDTSPDNRAPKKHGHFRKGAVDEWKTEVPPATRAQIEPLLDREVMTYFGWEANASNP